ncbi:MAG: hypothetical protein V4558_09755 [Gemmatimonadota bacterium]
MLMLLAACGGGATGSAGGALSASEVVGVWSVAPKATGCVSGPFLLTFTGSSDEVQPGGSLTFASTWSGQSAGGRLYGTVNLSTRSVVLRLFGPVGVDQAASVEGTLRDTLNTRMLIAQFTDPYAGLPPLFGAAGCSTPVIGTHTTAGP